MAVQWTAEQKKVIELRSRNILVSAAAGSGKTAVLVERILSKIMDPKAPVDIDRLLIMTFTRAAAGEMKERISRALEEALLRDPENEHLQRQMTLIHTAQITTIDGFCAYIIRNYFHLIGLDPGYRIADEGELELVISDTLKELMEDCYQKGEEDFVELVECFAAGKNDDEVKKMIRRVYNAAMSHPNPKEWLEKCLETYHVFTVEELFAAPWMKLLWTGVEEDLSEAEDLAEKALQVCEAPDGPYLYGEALQSDLAMVREMKESAGEESLYDLVSALENLSFKALSRKKMPDAQTSLKDEVKDIREDFKKLLRDLKNRYFLLPPEQILETLMLCRRPMETLVKLVEEFMERFAEKKRDQNLLDFTDMEHFALQILQSGEGGTPGFAARELSEKYDEVLVDEYQDSNLVQEMLTQLVSGWVKERKNIFMVGDVKQSIYRFRLARPELFMEKYRTYTLTDSSEQRIDLHKNFRSRTQVLDFVNYLFRRIMGEDLGGITYGDDEALYPGAVFPEGAREEFLKTEVLLVEKKADDMEDSSIPDERELEALAIAGRIEKIVGVEKVLDSKTKEYRPAQYGDIVILLRTSAGWAEVFTRILASRGIPAYTASRKGYFAALEVVTVLNFLRICDNPLQDIPLAGVLRSPIVGLSAQEMGILRADCPEGSLYQSVCSFVAIQPEDSEKEKLREKLSSFLALLEEMRDLSAYTPIHQLILTVLERTGYGSYAQALPDGQQRSGNLRLLVEKAMDYEKTSYRGLFHFIRYIENLQKNDVDFGEVNVSGAGSSSVQIMTIHKSKGLEFPIVFAAGLGKNFNFQDLNARLLIHSDLGLGVDAVIPEKRLVVSSLHKQLIRSELKKESLGEELRVLYVALTRAKEKLILTGTVESAQAAVAKISRYQGGGETLLPVGMRLKARNYWDLILPALAGHSCMEDIFLEDGILFSSHSHSGKEPQVEMKVITVRDLTAESVVSMADSRIQEEILKNWDSQKVYDSGIREILKNRFEYEYPFGYLRDIPAKVSVSDLKKASFEEQEEETEALFSEKEPEPIFPRFIQEKPEDVGGARRGTVYHRVMECLDYEKASSKKEVEEQLSDLVSRKKLSPLERDLVRPGDIVHFAGSPLGQRMGKAFREGTLKREQPFVFSVPASLLNENWAGPETVLVQGIIDAYFVEEGEIVLVDYKTDHVSRDGRQILADRYRVQLEDYAAALERLLKVRVKEKKIYSFALGEEIEV